MVIHDPTISGNIMSKWVESQDKKPSSEVTVNLTLSEGTTVKDANGHTHEVEMLIVRLVMKAKQESITLTPKRFQDVNIIIGEADNVFSPEDNGKCQIVALGKPGECDVVMRMSHSENTITMPPYKKTNEKN